MSLPAPKPLSSSPSLGPAAARIAAQDAQIAQLVQQARGLENTISQLRAQLEAEKTRGVAEVSRIESRWRTESMAWRDGCDSLQSKHRLAHLGTRVALEHERGLRLEDKEALVREKVARLLREHKITLFQARETDLVAQNTALEDEVEMHRQELTQLTARHEAEVARLTAQLTTSGALEKVRAHELGDFTQEKKLLKTELTTLRASIASHLKQIDRLNLQLENLRTQNATVEDRNRELQRQVDKWENLEGKGEKEIEDLRKRRIDLEVRIKELEAASKEARGLDKKVTKLEASLLETQEQVERGNQDIVEAQTEAAQARKQAAKLERQNKKLEAALKAERARSAQALEEEKEKVRNPSTPSSSKDRLQVPSTAQGFSGDSDDEVEAPKTSTSRRQKPPSVRSETTKVDEDAVNRNELGAENGRSKKKGKEKGEDHQKRSEGDELLEVEGDPEAQEAAAPAGNDHLSWDDNRDSDIEEVPPPTQRKPRPRGAQNRTIDESDGAKKPRSNTGKAKRHDTEERDEQEILPKKRARGKAAGKNDDLSGKNALTIVVETTDAEDDEQPQKKKRRKLNLTGRSGIFPAPSGFTWDQDDGGGLMIPSELSPVKEGQPVPARSGTSSLLNAFKIWK